MSDSDQDVEPNRAREAAQWIAGIAMAALFGGILLNGFFKWTEWLGNLFQWLNKLAEIAWYTKTFTIGALIGLAAVLFQMRKYRRDYYGILEITTAICVLWKSYGQPIYSKDSFYASTMIAIYLMIRGYDNLKQNHEEETAKRSLQKRNASAQGAAKK